MSPSENGGALSILDTIFYIIWIPIFSPTALDSIFTYIIYRLSTFKRGNMSLYSLSLLIPPQLDN